MDLSRRDVILAAVAVFIAWGFATAWVPSLRIAPHAFVAGVVSTLLGLLWLVVTTSWGKIQDEGQDYNKPSLAFMVPEAWKEDSMWLKRDARYMNEPVYPPSAAISDSIDQLLAWIMRDFVASWYGQISTRPSFINEVDRTVRTALEDIRDRLLAVDIVEVVVSRMVPLVTAHMRDFYEAERAVRGKKLSRTMTESEELDLAVASKYRDGKLHPAASLAFSDTKLAEQQHLRSVTTRLIPKVLPRNMTTSPVVTVLIREIVACAVLFPALQLVSDPDTWNQLMEAYGRTMLQDRKTVRRLRAALDEHAPPSPQAHKSSHFPRLTPDDNERKFERFVRAIRQCSTLSEARRFRSEVTSQLRKELGVEGQNPVYLRRLETGKRILDQKVEQMSASPSSARSKPKLSLRPPKVVQPVQVQSRLENASLRDVLYDASGLSYFMEFMDRQGLMRLVQFWIVVDGFRNPLEEDNDDPEANDAVVSQWTESERTDIAQINEAYLTKPELKLSMEARQAVKDFLKAGRGASTAQYVAARRAVLRAQTAIYHEMEDPHFRRFKRSDLFFKWVASDEASAAVGRQDKSEGRQHKSAGENDTPAWPGNITPAPAAKLRGPPQPDLRRAVASSSDLKSVTNKLDTGAPLRRSLDDTSARAPLFDDDLDNDPLARSTQSLDSGSEGPRVNSNEADIVDAMQTALNDIMEQEPDRESLFSESSAKSPQESNSMQNSLEIPRPASPMSRSESYNKPNIASLGLVGAPSRLGVFSDDNLFGEEEKFLEDEIEDLEPGEKIEGDEIHEAAPGDLGLAEAIDALTVEIDRLVTQESIVDSLTKKAELTNNSAELRILRKSKASLEREIRRKELQKQQYIVQESDNSLYGRADVSIQSIMVGNEEDGHQYAMYVIEVRRQAGEQMPAAVWVVARRYSEFHDLNKRLRAKYPQIRHLEFPRRQMVLKLQRDFLQKRRVALERYLKELLLIPAICRSRELRAFLSQRAINTTDPNGSQAEGQRDFVTRIYNSVTDGMEEFLGNIPVLDQLSIAGQNLISAATTQLNNTDAAGDIQPIIDPTTDAEAEAELRAFENRELEPFVKPICDLFLEAFELNRENNWLRGRAVVVVLHQLLGGTIERKVRENVNVHFQENTVVKYIEMTKDMLWPGGKPRQAATPRTNAEKVKSRREAGVLLNTLVPDLAGSVVGRNNAQAASRRILATMNNTRLNTHLVYTLLDEIVSILFSETPLR